MTMKLTEGFTNTLLGVPQMKMSPSCCSSTLREGEIQHILQRGKVYYAQRGI